MELGKHRRGMMHLEKERLYDDTMKLKIHLNRVRDENTKLKTRIQIIENEGVRKEKIIEDLLQRDKGSDHWA